MRVPTVGDIKYLINQFGLAFQNRLTALDNFGPEGEAGQVLTSNGADLAPTYQDASLGDPEAAIADPSGGAVIDVEARDAIANILETLRNKGIIDT